MVFDLAGQYLEALATGAGDWRGAGVGLHATSVGEPAAIVAELGEDAGAGQLP